MRQLIFALWLLVAGTAWSQVPAPAEVPPASDAAIAGYVDGSISTAVERMGLPSASVVVVRDGRTILQKSYGFADYAANRKADPAVTLYRQASISKLFGWILVMQQVEAGKLDLDTDVNRYLGFRIPDAFGKPITLRHLMTHSAGFTERLRGVFDEGPPAPTEGVLRANIPERVYAPGESMAYSNYGAALAAHIAERSAGKPFAVLVQERILQPLGMERSTFAQPLPAGLARDLAVGYAPGSREPLGFEWVGTPAAGALSATPADMGRFLAMLLNGGSLDGVIIVKPETLAQMLTLARPLAPGLTDGMGLGFIGGSENGVRYMGHLGNLAGTATLLTMLPDERLGVYVAFNGQGNDGAATRVRRHLLTGLIARFGQGEPVRVVPYTRASTAAAVAGTYLSARRKHEGFLTLGDAVDPTIVAPAGNGAITLSTVARSDRSLKLWIPTGPDRFAEAESGSALQFERDGSGEVTGMAGVMAYPVAEFDRAGDWLAWVLPALAGAVAILVVTLIAMPIYAITHRSRALEAPASRRVARTFVPARFGAVAMVAAIGLWVL